MADLHELTISEIASRIRDRTLSPVALAESLLSRIQATDPVLKAWVTVDADAVLQQARRAEELAQQKKPLSPLHGVPVGLKDIYYTRGMRTTAGSKVYADFVPEYDATTVTRLKRSGAIILGKTVTCEFASSSDNPGTLNPWDSAHTPGGTSTGSAVAVAARMCPAALGSQTGGSNLRPASYNGIVGLKATYGRVSRYGVIPAAFSLDHVGIMARTVEDTALMLNALAGYDSKDPSSSRRRVPDYTRALENGHAPRIGVIGEFFHDHADEETRAHTSATVDRLARSGAVVEELKLPESFANATAAQAVIYHVECSAYHEQNHRQRAHDYGPAIRRMLETGALIPAVKYVQAQRLRRRFRRDVEALARGVDVLLTPSTPTPAPRDLTTTGDAAFQGPWTFSGLPSITIPSGLSRSGLPLGVQMIASPFAEQRLLAAARWSERELNVSLRPPEPLPVH